MPGSTWPGSSFCIDLPHHTAAWLLQVGKAGGVVFGVQSAPMLQLGGLFSSAAGSAAAQLDRPSWPEAARQCQLATSYAVAYQPAAASAAAYGGRFTAAVELVRDRELAISFLHHMATQRQVRNPFEASGAWLWVPVHAWGQLPWPAALLLSSHFHHVPLRGHYCLRAGPWGGHSNLPLPASCLPPCPPCPPCPADVVGITNYLDVGFRMVADLAGVQGSQMQLGAAWQVRGWLAAGWLVFWRALRQHGHPQVCASSQSWAQRCL